VAVRVWHPPLWVVFSPLRWPAIMLRRLWRASVAVRRLNRRDHRKVCVIDGRVAWVGSFNIDGRHLRSLHGDAAWRDCGARVSGGAVRFLGRAFARAWRHAWKLGPRLTPPVPLLPLATAALTGRHSGRARRKEGSLVRLNDGLRLRQRNHRELIRRIRHATGRVWITSAYFLPAPALLRALGKAAAAGADVRVLIPGNSDVVFMPWIAWAFAHKLAKLGVGVWEYHGMIHAKTVVIDDWACVGSTNLNQRSWLHDLEADVVVTTPESRQALEQAFTTDIARARRVGMGAQRPTWQRVCGRLGLFFAYWL
jgi:cardiolipin synthase